MTEFTSSKPMRQRMEEYINDLQDQIVTSFEKLDPSSPPFKRDPWVRAQGGVGRSFVFAAPPDDEARSADAHQSILEKAGVTSAVVDGILPPAAINQMRADHTSMPLPDRAEDLPFFAAGISIITEPKSDPTASPKILAWWFGGVTDLTPSYLYEEDAIHFHSTLKGVCDVHGPQLYPTFKKWCGEYFLIKHRNETRGVGGIFFDDFNEGAHQRLSSDFNAKRPVTPDEVFAFIKDLGNAFVPSYLPILNLRYSLPYTPQHRRWQLIRRGRYVEFSLIYDQGIKFGLMVPTPRVESILMSLPETARWEYACELELGEGTEEAKLVQVLREPRAWV